MKSETSSEAENLRALTKTINDAWLKRYGGEPVAEISMLQNRIIKIAEDRDCWLANAKANQTEYLRLESKTRAAAQPNGGN